MEGKTQSQAVCNPISPDLRHAHPSKSFPNQSPKTTQRKLVVWGIGERRMWLLVKSRFGDVVLFGASIFERCGKSILLTQVAKS